jgi:hypothetical protein
VKVALAVRIFLTMGSYDENFGLSQLELARIWDCSVRNITNCNQSVDSDTVKYVILQNLDEQYGQDEPL